MTVINTTDDLLRAPDEQPAWYETVRARILGEELLKLPSVFSAFAEQVTQFVAEQRQFNAEQRQFNQQMESRVAGLEEFNVEQRRVNERIERRVTRIDRDIGQVPGYYANIRTERHAPAIADEMGLNFVARLDMLALVQYCKNPALGYVNRDQRRSFRNADLLMETHDGEKPVMVAMEVSFTADQRDTDRAIRNAHYLTQATGEAARAVVASVRNTREAQELIDLGVVYWYELIPEMLEADH